MVKKIIAVATAILMLCCMVPLAAFADDILDTCPKCGERTYETWQDFSTSVPDLGFPISIKRRHCTSCQYTYYDWNCMGYTGYKEFDSGSGNLIADYLKEWKDKTFGKNATAKPYQTGGGSAGTGGVGRHPSGYADDTGTPSVASNGEVQYTVYPRLGITPSALVPYPTSFEKITKGSYDFVNISVNGLACDISSSFSKWNNNYVSVYAQFSLTAPVSGYYYIASEQRYCTNILLKSLSFGYRRISERAISSNYSAGDSITLGYYSVDFYASKTNTSYTAYFHPIVIKCIPTTTNINNYNKITINNNTWNGNVYQDNSTNLTYIYPQYTTINENNETVTNISNNPIIYNNETKQYYTYDTVTNNYYYITYETPTPSPSPSPDPTPTPEPGGDTGDTTGILAVLVEIRDNMIQGFADLKATLVQGWADLSANFTLAIENLNLNITNIFNKKFPDQSTPETAEPSPSPSPPPSPEPPPRPTPDPGETPTPTPAPTDKPSNGNTNNFWNFVFPGGNDDGTENGHKGILWALISLLIAVVTFVLGLGSAYSYVFPFLPAGLVTTIHICVLVLLLFAIIKFVRSFL